MSHKKTNEQLTALLATCPKSGSRWRHYKTDNVYRVIQAAISESDQLPHVVYASEASQIPFSRPMTEWSEMVEHEGRSVPRFIQIG